MVSCSLYQLIEISDVDLWEFLFEGEVRGWPDNHRES